MSFKIVCVCVCVCVITIIRFTRMATGDLYTDIIKIKYAAWERRIAKEFTKHALATTISIRIDVDDTDLNWIQTNLIPHLRGKRIAASLGCNSLHSACQCAKGPDNPCAHWMKAELDVTLS